MNPQTETMPTKWILSLFILLTTAHSHTQTDRPPSADLFCISDCETCPVICSPPPSPSSSPPQSYPKLPPPLPPPQSQRYSPPQLPYYFDSPSPSSPPARPPPPSRPPPTPSSGGGAAAPPPPPSVYVYNPGTTAPSGVGPQRNFSFPYYYFYASGADCFLPLQYLGSIFLIVFNIFSIFI